MQSDEGEYIGGGGDFSYADPPDEIAAFGERGHITVSAGGWDFDFEAPRGRPLRPGRYANATRYPFNEKGPGLDVSGHGRGCNEVEGEFTVDAARFAGGEWKLIRLSFVHHCEGGSRALRGEIEYRSG
jgi:hypothetical protein